MSYVNKDKFIDLLESNLPSSSHYRYEFYRNYAINGILRGERIYKLLEKLTCLTNKRILDLGCGYGGSAIYFSQRGCFVLAVDIDYAHIQGCLTWAKEKGVNLSVGCSSAENLAISDKSFDIIILQDVIEHVNSIEMVAEECSRVLKKNGLIFLTLSNRISVPNILSDPHFGYFGIIFFPQKIANFYIKCIRKKTYGYEVKRYPSLKSIFNIFFSQGIILRKPTLLEKFYDSSLIASTPIKKITSFVKRSSIIKTINKIGLLQFFLVFYNRFISRGFMLIGEKKSEL